MLGVEYLIYTNISSKSQPELSKFTDITVNSTLFIYLI
jgi:hypothetical protein